MILPFRRDRLAERSSLDEALEREQSAREPPEERLAMALALSDLARRLARAAQSEWITGQVSDLALKARLWAHPLRVAAGSP